MARRQYSSPTPTTVRTKTDSLEMNGQSTRSCCNMPARPTLMPTVSNNTTYIYTHSLRLFSFLLPPSFSRLRRSHSENRLPSRIQGCKCLHTCRLLCSGGSGRHWHIRRPQVSLRYSPLLLTHMQRHQLFKTYVFVYRQGERVDVLGGCAGC